MEKPIVALIYDFDGTLSPRNMQEFSFIEALGMDAKDFWGKADKLSKEQDASAILCYMKLMIEEARHSNISIRRESFVEFGKTIEFFPGVLEWFDLINKYGKNIGLEIKHYINSSGLKEMIEGTKIAKYFEKIYACSFLYDVNGVAEWPSVAVDYTTKTQFIFKINKGIEEVSDNKKINEYVAEEDRRVPFKRIIYFGDGETDIPSMKMVKSNGGHSIAVYDKKNPKKIETAKQLIKDGRVHFACNSDYRQKTEIFEVVTTILEKIRSDYDFDTLLKKNNSSL